MLELTEENWREFVLNKAKANYSGELREKLKLARGNLLVNINRWSKNQNQYDHLDVLALIMIIPADPYSKERETLAALDPNLETQLRQLNSLLNQVLSSLTKLRAPDLGRLREYLSYL